MAIINITLDTARGDTLQGALHALMTSSRLEFPKYPEPTATDEPNPFRSNGETVSVEGLANATATIRDGAVTNITVTAPFQKAPAVSINGSPELDAQREMKGPALGSMDGDRKRGEPGAGHRRRTNAQIAEDEIYFKQRGHAAVAGMELGTESPETRTQTSDPLSPKSDAATTRPSGESVSESQISSGEARTNPEDDAQDAADEAAESAARKGSEPTLDDLRKVIGEYQKKFGMAQAAAKSMEYNGGQPIFEVPSKDIPLTIMRWQAAIEHDKPDEAAKFTPRPMTTGGIQTSEPVKSSVATREEVNAAINDYAMRFDGSLNPVEMVITKTDIPRLMERLFGAGKNNFNAIDRSPENYGRVIAAIQAEISKNTFGRTPK